MKRKLLQWFTAALVSVGALVGSNEFAGAQEVWRSYRGPYFNPSIAYYGSPYSSYYYGGPGIYRSYSVQPYSYSYGPVYSSNYRSYYAPSYTYRPYYGDALYAPPSAGFYSAPYVGSQFRVGPLRVIR